MIEIDFGKLLLLALIALIVLGPEKLPGAARTAGALLRRARSSWDSVRAEVERELEIEEIKRAAREAAAHAEAAQADMRTAAREFREVAGTIAASPRHEGAAPTDAAPAMHLSGESAAGTTVADTPWQPSSDDARMHAPPCDTLTGDLFADAPAHAPAQETPHGLA